MPEPVKKSDFTVEIHENGFLLYYHNHLLGGEGVPCSVPYNQRKLALHKNAKQRIAQIVNGTAETSYMRCI